VRQHLSLADSFQVTLKLFVEQEASECSACGLGRLRNHFHFKASARCHRRLLQGFCSRDTDCYKYGYADQVLHRVSFRCCGMLGNIPNVRIAQTRQSMIRQKTDPPRGILKSGIADSSRYRYVRYHPSPDLASYVEHFWVVEWDLRGQQPESAETLPHPSVHMIFESSGRSHIQGPSRAKFSRVIED